MRIVDSEGLFSGTKAVELRYQLNEVALAAWLTDNVTGYKGPLTIAVLLVSVVVKPPLDTSKALRSSSARPPLDASDGCANTRFDRGLATV